MRASVPPKSVLKENFVQWRAVVADSQWDVSAHVRLRMSSSCQYANFYGAVPYNSQ